MKISFAVIGAAALALAGCATQPSGPKPVEIELPRYMGTWRVIACMDNPVERKFYDATESYALTAADRAHVVFKWRDQSFTAPMQTHEFKGRVLDDPSHAVWKMKLFPIAAATYVVGWLIGVGVAG